MARRLDHTKGGHYEPDPARVQRQDRVLARDRPSLKGKAKRKAPTNPKATSVWVKAMKAVRHAERRDVLSQEDLLTALGFTKRQMRSPQMKKTLRRLISNGLLNKDGSPNIDHPKVIEIIINIRWP